MNRITTTIVAITSLLPAALAAQDPGAAQPGTPLSRAAPVQVSLEIPVTRPARGEVFEAAVLIADGAHNLASYALRVEYDPEVLAIMDIAGGLIPAFTAAPASDPASYTSGSTDFTAVTADGSETPAAYQAALIRFQVLGNAGQFTQIKLSSSPGGGAVDDIEYGLLPVRFAGPTRMQVGGEPGTDPRR